MLRSDRLLIEQLTYCALVDQKDNRHIKVIVQPTFVFRFELDPHSPAFLPGYFQVNSDKVPFLGPFSPYIQVDQMRINHYWTRDEDYFHRFKIPRRRHWSGYSKETITEIADAYNQIQDLTIHRFVPQLREKMGLP